MKKLRVQVPPIRKKDGTWACSEQEKTEIYARHLERVFLSHDINSELDIVQCQQLIATRKKIKHFTPLEAAKVIDDNLNSKIAPDYDEIGPKIPKELPKKAIIHFTYIYNAILHLKYISEQWKPAYVIMLLKPEKSPEDRNFTKCLKPIIEEKHLIPDHQFGFRNKHSTIDQVYCVTYIISKSLEEKDYCY
ncbi:Hypothetical protein CINCED_3A010330 [Cinara cedri]|uniref:Reverse transcriptase domain n=1 Tax=Cinara cedri TaxID=506608 RepID=A0A5E4MC50_9HEMI|nr:Hypothetical protein CINCED_3A010330 [Cinara cedri]